MSTEIETRDKIIEMLERRLKEEEQRHFKELERLRMLHKDVEQQKEISHQGRLKDLVAQNDAMLAALGRIHTRNQQLEREIEEHKVNFDRIQIEAKLKMEEVARRAEQEAAKAVAEIKALKEKLKDKEGK